MSGIVFGNAAKSLMAYVADIEDLIATKLQESTAP